MPVWILLVICFTLVAARFSPLIRSRRRGSLKEFDELRIQHKSLAEDFDDLRDEHAEARQAIRSLAADRDRLAIRAEREAIYVRALLDVFSHLEGLLVGRPTDYSRAIEKTILEPMCGVFSEQQQTTVKMAVLEASATEPFEYAMSTHVNWGIDAERFRWSKAEPLENLGFATQEAVLAAPILREGRAEAMLVAMAPGTFALEDRGYVALIATAIGLVRTARGNT